MKKIAFLLMLPLTLIFTRCDTGGREDGEENGTEETVDLGRVEELDLNEYGYPLVISVPQAGDIDSSYTIEEWEVRYLSLWQITVTIHKSGAWAFQMK